MYKFDYKIVTEPQDVSEILQKLDNHSLISFDCETTGLDFKRDKLYGLALGTKEHSWFVLKNAVDEILPHLATMSNDPKKKWIAWNAPFDLHFLYPHNFKPANLIDAQVAAWMVDENYGVSLKDQANLRLAIPKKELPEFRELQHITKKLRGLKYVNDATIDLIPIDKLGKYAARDARLTFDLWQLLEHELYNESLLDRFFDAEMPFIWLLWQMEENGFHIDQEKLDTFEKKYTDKLNDLLQQWSELTKEQSGEEVNPNSPQQVAEYFFNVLKHKPTEFTPTGAPSTKELVIKRITPKDKTGSAELLLELRSISKVIKTYVTNFQKLMYDGAIHAGYNRTGTVTGRLSSSGPNLQNIPLRKALGHEIRDFFVARPGMLLIVCDQGQAELRIAAHYSKDPVLMPLFQEGGDPHSTVSEYVSTTRFTAKTINYAKFYGCGVRATMDLIEEDTGVRPSQSETARMLRKWDELFKGITWWGRRVVKYARQHGYVLTIGGRKRRLHYISSPVNKIRYSQERIAVNAPIQGSVADIMQDCMLEMAPYIDWYGGRMLTQVHDEVIAEAPEDCARELAGIIQRIMEESEQRFDLRVPMVAEPGVGKSWTQAKKDAG